MHYSRSKWSSRKRACQEPNIFSKLERSCCYRKKNFTRMERTFIQRSSQNNRSGIPRCSGEYRSMEVPQFPFTFLCFRLSSRPRQRDLHSRRLNLPSLRWQNRERKLNSPLLTSLSNRSKGILLVLIQQSQRKNRKRVEENGFQCPLNLPPRTDNRSGQ